jgi:hypothetical protein
MAGRISKSGSKAPPSIAASLAPAGSGGASPCADSLLSEIPCASGD